MLFTVKLVTACRHEGYIQLPDRLPMSVAVGRSAMNLRSIYEETECVIVPSAKSSREVSIASPRRISFMLSVSVRKGVVCMGRVFLHVH